MSDLFSAAALTVSELNAAARNLLEEHLSGLWVGGEVSNLTRAASGHYYFSLKDSRAQVRCAMFKGVAQRFAALKEGDHIEVCGRISIYEARGEFQITVNEVRLKGLGRLYEAYEKLKAALQAEGLFAAERKRVLPADPQRIGIVTSPAAAALRDVCATLKRRAPDIPVILYPAAVQGADSAAQLARAVGAASERGECDVLIVCRGGGSIEDLWSFNEEAVVRAVAACRIPVVSGVGHETDFTLTDFAADLRAPTPTAAAELAAPDRAALLHRIIQAHGRLQAAVLHRYQDAAQRTDWCARRLCHPRRKLDAQRTRTEECAARLSAAARTVLRLHGERLSRQSLLLRHGRPDLAAAAGRLNAVQTALTRGTSLLLAAKKQRLEKQAALLEAVSPQHILARGFSVVKNSRGQVVRDAAQLKQGQRLHITFAEGAADVRVSGGTAQQDLFDSP
ncbi:Exodeoxyribonuclease 7 large subunit [Kingella potus]|uniref:Exodeoxyribonuclease 7 large subunit n=1 Tax=Kingella potus TaxID=265175 RepID=A0A377R5A2_9NEIS|nr:exodeoxyribonuclease VII large subunit [Kingella potus]STR03162.1 Exodeoxyribonuclease 7 large subunit [Kingella potus]